MGKNFQSIEDLKGEDNSQNTQVNDETTQQKFKIKQKEIKLKSVEKETEQKAKGLGIPYINLVGFPIGPDALSEISREDSQQFKAICFYYDGEGFRVGTVEPSEEVNSLVKKLGDKLHCLGKLYLISQASFEAATKLYDNLPKARKVSRGVKITEDDLNKHSANFNNFKDLQGEIDSASDMTETVAMTIAAAVKSLASDIHIEAEEKNVKIRLRVDGILHDAASVNKEIWPRIISRLKILAKVKININDRPQDGRFTILLSKGKLDVRVSFLPTAFGESVVMRILRPDSIKLSFDELGITPESFKVLEKEIKKPNGLILTTGPTGSGKTTTLYAILNKLHNPEIKIITIEDPIEYQIEGINQSQATEKYTFAKGLRSIVRQDPDVIMVGEIRDLETAEIAVQASLTGHLVLSTLHTNDASGVIPRLIEMGVKPFFLSPSINGIVGQRLVRKLCDKCKVEHKLSEEEKEKVNKILAVISPKAGVDVPATLPKIYKKSEGCEDCYGIGYKGRVGIYEIFTMQDNIKQLTADKAPAFKILEQAIDNGMLTMLQDGVLKCLHGDTSLEEIYRVAGKFDYVDTLYDIVVSKTIGRGIKIKPEEASSGEELSKNIKEAGIKISEIKIKEMLPIILATAVKSDAGDIHIEPAENEVHIRFRIDGILLDIGQLSKEHYLQLLSTIKVAAGFPTNVKQATWDGRFRIELEKQKIDCRVSIISGGYGETVVIRLLVNQASALQMDNLGMRPYILKPVERSMQKTKGIIINTGPTGSGKTTTLYAILNKLNKPDNKIITIEDPIEYHLDGIMQTQIDTEKGYTFAASLRSLLRQNPNIIMVGEIRDDETAKMAIEAATTGHLVLSTVHASSAAGAIFRFIGLGVERQMLVNTMECSIGQRLARRICQKCKKEIKLETEILDEVKEALSKINKSSGVSIPTDMKFYQGGGCQECGGLGYKGRVGIYEVIEMVPDLQKLIQSQDVTAHEIEQAAIKGGTVSILQDGLLKALEGETSVEEVLRVAK